MTWGHKESDLGEIKEAWTACNEVGLTFYDTACVPHATPSRGPLPDGVSDFMRVAKCMGLERVNESLVD
jgi:hypothetical protein